MYIRFCLLWPSPYEIICVLFFFVLGLGLRNANQEPLEDLEIFTFRNIHPPPLSKAHTLFGPHFFLSGPHLGQGGGVTFFSRIGKFKIFEHCKK